LHILIRHRCSEIFKKNSTALFRSSVIKNDDFFHQKYNQNEIEEAKGGQCFPDIFETEKHEEVLNYIQDSVPHKLPDLSNKYRKLLKDSSSSDELEQKVKAIKEPAKQYLEFDQKFYALKEAENELASNNINRSRSMLNRFNQSNTTDSRVNAINTRAFSNTLSKNVKVPKDDNSSASPTRMLNLSGNVKKKVKPVF
jgi:hypothetical protein